MSAILRDKEGMEMMNARERRDLEELRAYYFKVQEAIKEIQQKMNKIDLAACAEISETSLAAGAAASGERCLER